jgi:hypothetical protein
MRIHHQFYNIRDNVQDIVDRNNIHDIVDRRLCNRDVVIRIDWFIEVDICTLQPGSYPEKALAFIL